MPQTIWLLTHATEFNKASNTGQLVAQCAETATSHRDTPSSALCATGNGFAVKQIAWSRVSIDAELAVALTEPCLLVYPTADAMLLDVSKPSVDISQFQHLLMLDSTWQLARKMFNQSPYLRALPAIKLVGAAPSAYVLRRNQLQTGWCTAEIAMMLLNLMQLPEPAIELSQRFAEFNRRG
jgi:DTW domain-containing protein YfiP